MLMQAESLYVAPILHEKQLGHISIDLRLGNMAVVARARRSSHVDPRLYSAAERMKEHKLEQDRRQKMESHDLPFFSPLVLHPGTLTLVPTLEWVRLPVDLKGVVTARSSWAREGLSIATATFIHPGYQGIITLELSNLGQVPIAVYPGMRIAQIAFYRVPKGTEHPEDHEGDGQFRLSFEPRSGEITRYDEAFIPPLVSDATTKQSR